MTAKERFKKAAFRKQEGCPLFDGRESADLEQLEGEIVHLLDAYPMTGKKGNRYYVVTFEEYDKLFFFSSKALTDILDEADKIASEEDIPISQVIEDTAISIQAPVRTKDGNKFRPIDIVDA